MNHTEGIENVLIGNWHARLPSAICTDPTIFNTIFSTDTWENVLGTEAKRRILQMLPKEVLSCQGLAVQTIHDLLTGELSRFSSTPLETFFNQLDGGLFEPSVVPTKEAIKKVWRKDSKRIIKKCQIKVLQELLLSTTKYLEENFSSKEIQSNGIGITRNSPVSKSNKDSANGNNRNKPPTEIGAQNGPGEREDENELKKRAKKRFLAELSEINSQGNCASSDDEEFPIVKKPTRHTFGDELMKQAPVKSNLAGTEVILNKKTDHQSRPAGLASLNATQALIQPQRSSTPTPSAVKPISRPATLKSREEQTAVQMAKFPKILPAPSIVSPTETTSKSAIKHEETNVKTQNAVNASQFKKSPLLASQLQAPLISSNKHSSQSDMQLANRVLQMHSHSNTGSSYTHSPLDMVTILDEMDSSSEDEFESIEPTIGFASSTTSPAPKPPSKAVSKGSKGPNKNLQTNSKTKSKTSTKQPVSNIKLTPSSNSSSQSTSLSSTSVVAPTSTPSSVGSATICTESTKVSFQPSTATNQGHILLGLAPTPSSSGTSGTTASLKLQTAPILITSGLGGTGSPINVTPAPPSSSTPMKSLATATPPTIKLTPGFNLSTNTIGTNKLLSALTPTGIGLMPDGHIANIATTVRGRPSQSQPSFNITTSAITSGNSNVLLLNGPLKNECTQNESAKNTPVFRIQCGPNTQTFTTRMNSTTSPASKQYLATTSRISGSLGSTLVSPITLQDLNFSLNSDGNVVQSNTTEQKLLADNTEDKIDDLSVLDGNPFDSIPNLSDELDGFDLDLVEVCDFHSLVSEEKHYASFFSLIRDVLCSTKDHRMTFICLEKTIRKWSFSPSASSNAWFTRVSDWNEALSTALNFLAGNYQDAHPEDFVPYIEYKYKTKYYQWIGAGRDSDNNMLPLCNMWLDNLGRLPPIKKLEADPEEPEEDDDDNEDSDSPDLEVKKKPKRPITPPPPRCVTAWTVRPSNDEEREYFQEQEHQRFENPHKAFTYRMHEYESVVGPVKGVYSNQSGVTNKARGHSLLIDDRPPYVTILALVRDAVARLPNGEGTRSEICEMLRDSAFLAPEASNVTLNSVVSGALDRLHYERDPCVRYDSHKKSWIYLHRDRNQEQFERLHHNRSYTKSTKSRSNTSRKGRKHNKSTSSSGSQSHGQVATPSTSSSPTTSDQLSSGATSSTVSTVKLPPIETMLGKSGNVALAHTGMGESDIKPRILGVKSLSQSDVKTEGVYLTNVSKPARPASTSTLLAAQLSKPIATSANIHSANTSGLIRSNPTTLGLVSNSTLQTNSASIPTGQFMLGSNNLVRFGGPLRFSPVRVPVSGASAGLRLSPRIVLRGSVSNPNQGIIVGQTPDGQTIIFQATPSTSGVGTMQVQLSSAAGQAHSTGQPIVVTSNVSGQVVNINSTRNMPSPASVAIIQNSKVAQNANVVRQNVPETSKLQRGSILNASVERPQQGVNISSQVPKPVNALSSAGVSAQTSPILIKSNQGNFIVPARIYGAGPVGEFKMVPLPGAGNQTVYARIVPQSSDLSSVPSVRFVTTPAENTPSSQ